MPPSGGGLPQRFKQARPMSEKSSSERYDDLCDRRKKCRKHFNSIKAELNEATALLQKLDQKAKSHNSTLIKLDPFSFMPKDESAKNSRWTSLMSSKSTAKSFEVKNFLHSLQSE